MNKLALAVALALVVASTAQAKLIELVPGVPGDAAAPQARVVNPALPAPPQVASLPPSMSELPEPEVFAMMLVGLVLLGYRVRRESSEKFK